MHRPSRVAGRCLTYHGQGRESSAVGSGRTPHLDLDRGRSWTEQAGRVALRIESVRTPSRDAMQRSRVGFGCASVLVLATVAAAQPAPPSQLPPRPLNPTQEIAKEQPEGPSLAVGPARLRIGGYVGLHGIYRSTNSGGGVGTNFATIPYADTVQGNVSESRLSAQASRLSIRVDADYPEGPRFNRLSGYFEMDFAGSTPGNVAVTTSGVGFRLRLAFAEVRYGQNFFLAAGQAFSLMTAPEGSAVDLAGGRRTDASRRPELRGGHGLESVAPAAPDVAPVDALQLGGVG